MLLLFWNAVCSEQLSIKVDVLLPFRSQRSIVAWTYRERSTNATSSLSKPSKHKQKNARQKINMRSVVKRATIKLQHSNTIDTWKAFRARKSKTKFVDDETSHLSNLIEKAKQSLEMISCVSISALKEKKQQSSMKVWGHKTNHSKKFIICEVNVLVSRHQFVVTI